MISIQQIQYILQLQETGNFSKAADACFVTQPTLSMQIKKAEELLGFSIFDRNKHPLELTPLGRQLIPVLREMNQANNAIVQLSKRAAGTYTEELIVGVIPTISPYLIPMLYQKWKKALKHTRLIIKENKTEELLELLENKKLDFIIIAGPAPDAGWKIHKLYTEELLVYTQKKDKNVLRIKDLEHQKPWLLSQGNCLRSQMMQFCRIDQATETEWNFEGGNMELLIQMVDMNGGYTLVPEHYKTLLKNTKGAFHPIRDPKSNVSPARSIIGLQSSRNTKSESIQKIAETIQLALNKEEEKKFSIVEWK